MGRRLKHPAIIKMMLQFSLGWLGRSVGGISGQIRERERVTVKKTTTKKHCAFPLSELRTRFFDEESERT